MRYPFCRIPSKRCHVIPGALYLASGITRGDMLAIKVMGDHLAIVDGDPLVV